MIVVPFADMSAAVRASEAYTEAFSGIFIPIADIVNPAVFIIKCAEAVALVVLVFTFIRGFAL